MWSHFGQLRLGDSRGRDCHIYDVLTNVDREPFFSRRTVIAVEGLFWSNVDEDKDEDR